uniref:EAL domain-containing protein n=1 Tax=Agathobacter sp. TaxID=2021311 RepID=UPI0040573F71
MERKQLRHVHIRTLALFVCFALTIGILGFGNVSAKADVPKTIRVGYDVNASFIQESNGEYYGYGVEYLEKIAEYTGWEYEFVEYHRWSNSLENLKMGEIDLICTAHYMEEREEYFIYSDIPLGYEATILYAAEDADIAYQQYEAMNGCAVGFLSGSYSAQEFIAYAEEKDIQFTPVYFDDENDMLQALKDGDVQLLAIGSRYTAPDMKMIDRLGANAFYCITNKENPDLIEEIEEVLQQMKFENPEFEGKLLNEYFGHAHMSDTPLYTLEELEYIENLDSIRIKIMQTSAPLAYMKDGKPTGIFIEYLNLLSKKSGVKFEYEMVGLEEFIDSQDELMDADSLVLRTERALEAYNLEDDTIHTNALFETTLSYIQNKNIVTGEEHGTYVLGMTEDKKYMQALIAGGVRDCVIEYYENTDKCLDALLKGKVDIVIQESYLVNYALQKPEYSQDLIEANGKTVTNAYCLAGNSESGQLIAILNKAVNHITETEKNDLINDQVLLNAYQITLVDILRQYAVWIVSIGVILVGGIVIYTIMTKRLADAKVQKAKLDVLQKKVHEDELTGAYNRTYFFERAAELIAEAEEEMCIVALDVCNFKFLNETYGMEAGDQILWNIAHKLQELGEEDNMIVARFMSDQFYMCLTKKGFEKIKFPQFFETPLEELAIKVVYGVFFARPKSSKTINVMCDRARTAARRKDEHNKNYIHYYTDEEHRQIKEEREIESEMEKALLERQFCIYIQPKFDVETERVVGGETLVRWIHPQKGMIAPYKFIPLFERNGFIIRLDYYIWEETCRLLADLKQKGYPSKPISINVSRAHFYGDELKEKLEELIEKYQLDPSELELEITETICAVDPEAIYSKVKELRKVGFKVAMDDFGSGYSSLNMLKEMPLDIIKMDLKFLDGGDAIERSRYILSSLICLAQNMQLCVVVEGVETREQINFLKEIGNHYVQGYYFSKPVETKIYEGMLKNEQINEKQKG